MAKFSFKKVDLSKTKYVQTFLVAIFCSFLVVVIASIYARMSIDDRLYVTKESQSKVRKKIAESILSQGDLLEKIYSDDYRFNMYIAGLNQSVGDFLKAEYYYKRAVELVPDGIYDPHLRLIALYLEYKKPEKAEDVLADVIDKNSQKLFKFKCNANILLGDYYYKNNIPKMSVRKYNLANFYFDKMKRRVVKIREYIENGILASNVKIADNYVAENNYIEAYKHLKVAERYNPADMLIKYKIALVLSHIKPQRAIKYFDIIKTREPQLVSFNLYYETLMRAAEIATMNNKMAEAKLYNYKAGSVKTFYENNIVNSEVLLFDFLQAKIQPAKKSDKFSLKFRMANISHLPQSDINMEVHFYNKTNRVASFHRVLFPEKERLKAGRAHKAHVEHLVECSHHIISPCFRQ